MGAANAKTSLSVSFTETKSVAKPLTGHNKNDPISFKKQSRQNSSTNLSFNDRSPRFVEDIILVWLDATLEKPNESTQKTLGQLVRVTNIIKTFSDLEQCFQFIKSIENEQIFVIVSGSLGQQLVSRIEHFKQVHSIFIFCGNKANHEQWIKPYKKVRSLHTQARELSETVRYQIRQYDKSITSISILPNESSIELNSSNKEFIIYQVMKIILIEIQYDKTFRREFMNYSRQFYSNNSFQLNIIDTFEDNYTLHSPIWWYTRRCCIYTMLRRAFYLQDSEIIYKLAFFIRDLHRDIKKSYSQVHNHQHRPISLYRSTQVTVEMFTYIEKNHDGLLAFNDFLLTTLERSMALKFANALRKDPKVIALIYKIDIDPVASSVPYISLNNLSYLSDTEGEFLLSMNTIFRIQEMEKLGDRLYEVSLIPVTKKDELIRKLTEYIQTSTANIPGWYKLSKIMMDAHEYNQVESLYLYLLGQIDENRREERAYLLHELGYIQDLKNNLPSAINYYKQVLESCQKFLPNNHAALATTYANLASVLQKQGDLLGALNYYQQASKTDNADELNNIIQSNNIATVLQAQGKYSEAQRTYESSIQTLLQNFPTAQSVLADTYTSLAGLFYGMKDYKKALINYQKVLDIEEKSLPINHSTLTSTYFNIATTYDGLEKYKKAIPYAEKAVEIAVIAFGNDHFETEENRDYLEHLLQQIQDIEF